MTDEDLIEKAARAAYAAVYGYEPQAFDPGEGHDEDWRAIARSVLAVFREHTAPTGDERQTLIDLKLATFGKRMSDGYMSLFVRDNEEAADLVIEAGFRRGAPAKPAVTPQITEADIQAQAAALAAEIHEAWEFQYDECDHSKYSGGPLHGEPYAMCELSAARIIRRRAYILETALTEGEKP